MPAGLSIGTTSRGNVLVRRAWSSLISSGVRRLACPLAMALLLALVLLAPAVSAEEPIRVLSSECKYQFSVALHFDLSAEGDCPIVEVILFYGPVDSRLVRRIYPDIKPGLRVDVSYTEDLEGGQYAPGTQMHTWWELVCEDGSRLRTEPVLFEYTDLGHDWQVLSSERVDLHWYGTSKHASQAAKLCDTAEKAIARLEDEIGVSMEHRVHVYVYNTQGHMRTALSTRSEVYDDRVMTLGVVVSKDTLLLLGSHRDVEMVILHELCHLVVGLATDNPYTDLPRWLDEGLAMYAEGEFPADNKRALDRAIADDALLSIRSMSSYSGQAEQVDLYYGEVRSVVDFMLQEYGRDQMHELLAVFAQGTRQEDALQQVYGFGLDELDTRWRASLGLGARTLPQTPEALQDDAQPVTEPDQEDSEPICSSVAGVLLAPLLMLAVKRGLMA